MLLEHEAKKTAMLSHKVTTLESMLAEIEESEHQRDEQHHVEGPMARLANSSEMDADD